MAAVGADHRVVRGPVAGLAARRRADQRIGPRRHVADEHVARPIRVDDPRADQVGGVAREDHPGPVGADVALERSGRAVQRQIAAGRAREGRDVVAPRRPGGVEAHQRDRQQRPDLAGLHVQAPAQGPRRPSAPPRGSRRRQERVAPSREHHVRLQAREVSGPLHQGGEPGRPRSVAARHPRIIVVEVPRPCLRLRPTTHFITSGMECDSN